MRDDGCCPLHDIELRSVAHDKWITGQCAEGCRIEAAAERDHELKIEADACLGDLAKDVLCAVLQSTERGINEGAAIEAVPGKFHVGSARLIDKGAGVMEKGRRDIDLEL